jgi:hypothetical protein
LGLIGLNQQAAIEPDEGSFARLTRRFSPACIYSGSWIRIGLQRTATLRPINQVPALFTARLVREGRID